MTEKSLEFLKEKTPPSKEVKKKIFGQLMDIFWNENHTKKEQVKDWFSGYLKNHIYKNKINIEDIQFQNKIKHALDYFNSTESPNKFHAMTFEQLDKNIKKWENWLQNRAEKGDDPHNVKLINDLSDNWKAVSLESKIALSYEGGVMRNCVGSYHDKVKNGTVQIISLRDKKDDSKVTIELDNKSKTIIQVKGKQNKLPIEPYRIKLREFIKNQKMTLSNHVLREFGYKQLGNNYISVLNHSEYEEALLELLKNTPDYNEGGIIDLSTNYNNIKLSGSWDKVVLNNVNNISFLDNFKTNELMINNGNIDNIKGMVSFLNINNSNIKLIESNTDKIYLSKMVMPELKIADNTSLTLESISNINLPKNTNYNALYLKLIKENIDIGNIKGSELHIDNQIGEINYNPKNWGNLNVDDYLYNEILLDETKDNKFFIVKGVNNIKTIKNTNIEFIEISDSQNLKSIENIKSNHAIFKNLTNIENLSKNKINSLEFIFNKDFDKEITTRRNRIKKLKTNKIKFFREKNKNKNML